jgi:hypothetical protein
MERRVKHMKNFKQVRALILVAALSIIFLSNCTPLNLNIVPEKTPLTPALIKKQPIKFSGVGFQPNEAVIIEIIVPKGMTIKGQSEGEDRVGIAVAVADEKGNFEVAMGALTTLNTLFQVGWTKEMKPDFKKAKPIPPGKYFIVATGVDSDKTAKNILEIASPPKKK